MPLSGYARPVLRVELTVEIARPATEVFGYLTDVEKLPDWQSSVVSVQADESLREGARFVERRRFLGREAETELEVTAYEPGRRFALRSLRGSVELSIDHELREADGSTRLQVTATARPGRLLRFAGRVVEARARQELHRDFERLKEVLER